VSTTADSPAREAFATARAVLAGHRAAGGRRPMTDAPGRPAGAVPSAARRGTGTAAPRPGTIAAALDGLASGELTCRDLVEAALAAAGRAEALGGVVARRDEAALAEADAHDRLPHARRGALHGIPVTVKDVIDVAGMPTAAGSDAYLAHPAGDAAAVARLRAAGAIVVGKVSTHEFALGVTTPQSRNPHDPSRIPGGSSGGSGIAVTTGFGLASLGTDTRASIRVPSALCGVVGLKPTYGTVPTAGLVSLAWTMDHVGPLARDTRDAALALEALAPGLAGLASWAGAPVATARVGIPEAAFAGCDPEVERAVRRAIAGLAGLGVGVTAAERPNSLDLDRASAAGLIVSRAEAAANHRALGIPRARLWDETADQLDEADGLSASDYIDAQRLRAELASTFDEALDGLWALAMPTAPCGAPRVEDAAHYITILSRTAIPWSLTGLPAISVPCGVTGEGLPIGLQLVAGRGREHLLVALASAVERTLGL
jgi:aspartyl-tRNA(Asn)/glutamyl-tRNA(Gln) amidotransferase subunit A